jgi:hypothetical protein
MSIPRLADVPGYSKNCRDMTKFEEAARAYAREPVLPRSRLCPGQSFEGNSGSRSGPRQHAFNDFYLEHG